MANRVLRDWTDSFIINDLDANTERFFVRLIMRVDDYGRFSADERLLKSNLFPLKTDIRESDISRWLTACEKSGLITVYTVASKKYLEIQNFNQRLRIQKAKYPSAVNGQTDDGHLSVNRQAETIENEENPVVEAITENGGQLTVNGQTDDGLKRNRNRNETEIEIPPNPQGGIASDKIDFKKLIEYINKQTGREFKVINDAVKRKFNARLKEGYSKDDILSAIKNAVRDEFHRDKNFKYLTPEYFSRSATIDQHRSTIERKEKQSAQKYSNGYIPGPFN